MTPRERLAALPRAGVGHRPTPLHRVDRFAAALADRFDVAPPEVWIKRDDIQGVAFAGNKVRKFDLVVGQAIEEGYDTIVTTGAVQSNSARAGAAAAAAAGLDCVLVLSGREPTDAEGNVLLDHLLGAEVRFVGRVSWSELNEAIADVVAERSAAGRRVLAAPVGCSSPLGSLGFADAFLELDAQLTEQGIEPAAIVHTTTSGGTHAGLLVGRALAGRSVRLIGIDAADMFQGDDRPLADLATEAAGLIDFEVGFDVAALEVVRTQIGPRYGAHTEAATAAIALLARTEAIITDPVYSGKGLAGLIELVATEEVDGPVIFWHTGGYHALFDPLHGSQVLERLASR